MNDKILYTILGVLFASVIILLSLYAMNLIDNFNIAIKDQLERQRKDCVEYGQKTKQNIQYDTRTGICWIRENGMYIEYIGGDR